MSLVVITKGLYSPGIDLEPSQLFVDHSGQDDQEYDNFEDILFYAFSGDVKMLYPHVYNKSDDFLKSLIAVLLEVRVNLFCVAQGVEPNFEDKEWFVTCYNDLVGLTGNSRFPSRSTLLHYYFNGAFTDAGQDILSNLAGTKDDFKREVRDMIDSFRDFAYETGLFRVHVYTLEDESDNPFEGGYQVKLELLTSGSSSTHQCTLHWSPWFTAKTNSDNYAVRSLCNQFTNHHKEKSLSSIFG